MSHFTPIQVDRDVFEFLQAKATPFVDTPNDVLRRLLLPNSAPPKEAPLMALDSTAPSPIGAEAFVRGILRSEFQGQFRLRKSYRLMFESDDAVVYFQNFNKESDHLWYRVAEQAWKDLTSGRKAAWLCLTNPAAGFAYLIPVSDIQRQVHRARWTRNYLEVNIDPSTSRWSELDWRLDDYLKRA